MARLPNSDQVILELRKIEDYCLNPLHPRGRHKARVFRNALGIGRADARWLHDTLAAGARETEAIELISDTNGRRWRVDMRVERQNRKVVVRTIWIIRAGEDIPRFVTCWVL